MCLQLAEMPADILEEGFTHWIRNERWWPTPSDLLDLMEPKLAERRAMLRRAEQLRNPTPEKPERHWPTKAERTGMADMAAAAIAILKEGKGLA